MVRYLCVFVQQHPSFRYRELLAVASMFNIKITGIDESLLPIIESEDLDISSPFLYMDLESDEAAKKICSRSVLVRGFFRVWAESPTYEGIIEQLNSYDHEYISTFHKNKTWKIEFDSFGKRYSKEDQLERMHRLKPSALWTSGKVAMKPNGENEHIVWRLIENYGLARNIIEKETQTEKLPQNIYVAQLVATGNRECISQFNLQDRKYLGTTSMDPELSVISANMGHVRPGTFMLDPFVGTGSFILISSYFGAQTIGCDIDVAAMRKTQSCNLETNFEEHKLIDNLLGLVICDNSIPPWRDGPIFDSIITDPPYGIRAGAKRVGFNKNRRHKAPPEGFKWSHMAQTTEYKVPDVMADLLELAAKKLVLGGKLVYWLPTTPDFKETDLPKHPCLKLISNCLQTLTMRWGRRLITMEKVIEFDPIAHDKSKLTKWELGQIEPQHGDLRTKVYHKGTGEKEKSKKQLKKERKREAFAKVKSGELPPKEPYIKKNKTTNENNNNNDSNNNNTDEKTEIINNNVNVNEIPETTTTTTTTTPTTI